MSEFIQNLYVRTFILAHYDIFRLYWMMALVWLVEQLISIAIEHLLYGESFVHWFDVAFTVALSYIFFHFAWTMAITKTMIEKSGLKDKENDTV